MGWTELKPIGARVLVRLHDKRAMLGSIHIPDEFRRAQQTCEVIAVGPKAPQELKPGQIGIIGKFNGVEIPPPEHDPKGEYRILNVDYLEPAPSCPDLYALLEDAAGDVTERCSSDMPKKRRER